MQRGFMLFECMLVVAIVVFFFSMGFIGYTAFKGTSFTCDVALISLLMHTASTRARCLQTDQIITFNQRTAESEMLFNGRSYPLLQGYFFGVLPDVYGPPSNPKNIITQPITFIKKKLVAYADGTMQSGTLYITDGKTQYAITTPVSAFSHIRAYRYTHKKWEKYC